MDRLAELTNQRDGESAERVDQLLEILLLILKRPNVHTQLMHAPGQGVTASTADPHLGKTIIQNFQERQASPERTRRDHIRSKTEYTNQQSPRRGNDLKLSSECRDRRTPSPRSTRQRTPSPRDRHRRSSSRSIDRPRRDHIQLETQCMNQRTLSPKGGNHHKLSTECRDRRTPSPRRTRQRTPSPKDHHRRSSSRSTDRRERTDYYAAQPSEKRRSTPSPCYRNYHSSSPKRRDQRESLPRSIQQQTAPRRWNQRESLTHRTDYSTALDRRILSPGHKNQNTSCSNMNQRTVSTELIDPRLQYQAAHIRSVEQSNLRLLPPYLPPKQADLRVQADQASRMQISTTTGETAATRRWDQREPLPCSRDPRLQNRAPPSYRSAEGAVAATAAAAEQILPHPEPQVVDKTKQAAATTEPTSTADLLKEVYTDLRLSDEDDDNVTPTPVPPPTQNTLPSLSFVSPPPKIHSPLQSPCRNNDGVVPKRKFPRMEDLSIVKRKSTRPMRLDRVKKK